VCLALPLPVARSPAKPVSVASTPRTSPGVPRPPPSVEQARRTGRLVLVVDDHPVNRMLLAKQINTLGYAAEAAGNGLEAVDRWNLGGIGAVITDCHMPEMDGYGLARHIRECEERHGHRRIPIIACTANAFGGVAERCFAAGMDDYVVKPASLEQLRHTLQQWLALPEATETRAPSADPIDGCVLAEISHGDVDFERELLAEFWRYSADDASALRQAIAKDDLAGVVRASHRIRGSSAAVGAASLSSVCEELERAGRETQWWTVRSTMESFDREFERVRERISNEPLEET